MKLILFIFALVVTEMLSAQVTISGRVINKETGEAMPFVNIIYNQKKEGLTSNIDGRFLIDNVEKVEFLQFSYVGFKNVLIPKDSIYLIKNGTVFLYEKNHNLKEVVVYPGENPAHRIIKQVIANRKLNNPDKLSSYSYTAYHKMVFTIDAKKVQKNVSDTLSLSKPVKDSSSIKIKEFFDTQHLFLMESVSNKKFRFPAQHSEEIIATRVSGFKEPSMVILANQLQSFSFYDDMITLAESRYVNPIGSGSTKKYFFNIEDTTYTERGDTVFSISFQPKKKKNFEALKGVLQINTFKYAVQSVVAEPVEPNGIIGIEIKQQYKLIDDTYWFPIELNTNLIFYSMIPEEGKIKFNPIGIGKTYIEDIKVNHEIKRKDIGNIDFEVNETAHKQSDSLWNMYRHDSLSVQDIRTYEVIDSIGKKHKLDLKLKFYKTLFNGYYPVSFVNIDFSRMLDFNVYEGFRPGLGLYTNDKLVKNVSLGGYFAYGFQDDRIKYGASLDYTLSAKKDLKLGLNYKSDLGESSGYQFLENPGMNSTESYRYWFIQDMTYVEEYKFDFQFRPFRKFKSLLSIRQFDKVNTSGFFFNNGGEADFSEQKYHFMETAVQLAYTPNETLFFIDNEFMNSYGSTPALYANVSKGFKNEFGDFDYLKIETKLLLSVLTKNFGKTNLVVTAGKVFGDLPYFELYNGHASYYDFTIETANSFATMRMNEFLSDQFVAIYLRQDFGSLLFKSKKFKPEILLITSFAFGNLKSPELQQEIDFRTMENGYFESGILLNNLIRSANIMGLGFGVYYRYGHYAFSETKENFAYKLSFTFDL